jgi:rfaE bifunctional protein nucleotidyltransferase chain/domain
MKSPTIVLVSGGFDVLHVGHLRLLRHAAALGDMLIVAVNDDASVRALKGPSRPVNPCNERMEMLAALRPVNQVISFPELTAVAVIRRICPNVVVWGDEKAKRNIPEEQAIVDVGAKLVRFAMVSERSTTLTLLKGSRGR